MSKEIITNVGGFIKDNAGKLAGALALGVGIGADVIRAKKHNAKLGDDNGNVVDTPIDTIAEDGTIVPEPEKKEE